MDNAQKEEGKCGSGCGLKCGCCVCKTIKAVVLLLIGGAIGYYMGRGCAMKSTAQQAPAAAPAAPAPARK